MNLPKVRHTCLLLLTLAGCSNAPSRPLPLPAQPPASPAPVVIPEPEPVQPAPVPAAEPAKPVEARKPKPVANIAGTWEGEWEVDEYGFTGRAVIVIDKVEGRAVTGRSMMYETPYGTLNEPFLNAVFDGAHLSVKHRKNVAYTLNLSERGSTSRLAGAFTYVTHLGTFTGKINVVRK